MEKKATKRALQAQRTKENIYRCGVKLFREYGFEAVTVEQLAKAAGVGIGTFYHYYPSKMALYTELFIHAEDYFEEFETGQALQGSAYDVLQQYFKKYAALNAEPGQEFAQVLVTREGRAFLGGNRDFEKKLEALLAHYQQEGQLNTSRTAAEWCEYLFICARGVLFDWSIHPSTDYDVDAAIPKFKSEYSIELKDTLQNMGMTDAFDEEQADFRGIGTSDNGNIYINMVLHKTYIEVDEQGTKAGASTVVGMAETMSLYEPEIKTVHLDRPFVYAIIDTETQMPIFLGVTESVEE